MEISYAHEEEKSNTASSCLSAFWKLSINKMKTQERKKKYKNITILKPRIIQYECTKYVSITMQNYVNIQKILKGMSRAKNTNDNYTYYFIITNDHLWKELRTDKRYPKQLDSESICCSKNL